MFGEDFFQPKFHNFILYTNFKTSGISFTFSGVVTVFSDSKWGLENILLSRPTALLSLCYPLPQHSLEI